MLGAFLPNVSRPFLWFVKNVLNSAFPVALYTQHSMQTTGDYDLCASR